MITLGHRAPAPTDLVGHLLECHSRIRSFVALAARAGATIGQDAEVVEACASVERYFQRALPLHIEDEEQSIVPRLRGRSADVDEALRTMEAQHRGHEPLIKRMLLASRAVREAPGAAAARERLRLAAAQLSAEFEPHLILEEGIIFPALRSIGPEVRARIRAEQRTRRKSL